MSLGQVLVCDFMSQGQVGGYKGKGRVRAGRAGQVVASCHKGKGRRRLSTLSYKGKGREGFAFGVASRFLHNF